MEELDKIMGKIQTQIEEMEKYRDTQRKNITENVTVDHDQITTYIQDSLQNFEDSIVQMYRICSSKTESIVDALTDINQDISCVDGRMNAVKSAKGTFLATKEQNKVLSKCVSGEGQNEIHQNSIENTPPILTFKDGNPQNISPNPGDLINYGRLKTIGLMPDGQTESTDLIPLCDPNKPHLFTTKTDYFL